LRREEFIDDLLNEYETEIRRCLDKGAYKVQVDFTEARQAVKLDPSGDLLNSFIELNNLALSRFTPEEETLLGIDTCPGTDRDSTHYADVDCAQLLSSQEIRMRVAETALAAAVLGGRHAG
jgi:5-methyltetrahydropteroyltriglutamate--homocysteine methyltransferase